MHESHDITANGYGPSIAGMRNRMVRQVDRLESVMVRPKRLSLWPLLTGQPIDPEELDPGFMEVLRNLPKPPVPDSVELEIAAVATRQYGLKQIASDEPHEVVAHDNHENGD